MKHCFFFVLFFYCGVASYLLMEGVFQGSPKQTETVSYLVCFLAIHD